MNDYTAHLLRTELNRERMHLEIGQRQARETEEKLAQQQQSNREAEQRIAALTATLDAAGASTEPWPDPFARTTATADA